MVRDTEKLCFKKIKVRQRGEEGEKEGGGENTNSDSGCLSPYLGKEQTLDEPLGNYPTGLDCVLSLPQFLLPAAL